MIAQDAKLCADVQQIAASVRHDELEVSAAALSVLPPKVASVLPSLRDQPDFKAVEQIIDIFRGRGVDLSVYEGCEVNRWLFQDRDEKGGGMKDLKEYWQGLKDLGNKGKGNPDFEAMAGALAIDGRFRFDFADGRVNAKQIGITLDAAEENKLRELTRTGTQADIAAKRFASFWSGSCIEIAKLYDGWFHINA